MANPEQTGETLAAVRDCLEQLPSEPDTAPVVFGFDGFIDKVRVLVDERGGEDSYERLTTLEELGDRIARSAKSDSSLSVEWLETDVRAGGHTAHLSRAYGILGYDPTVIGTFGRPLESPFEEEFSDFEHISVGRPGYTDAIEFDDGKLMLIEMGSTSDLTWRDIKTRVPPTMLCERLEGASLLSIGYFADIPQLPSVVSGLRSDVWPRLENPPDHIVIDPGDVRKLTDDQLECGLTLFEDLESLAPLTISANRVETSTLATAIDDSTANRSLADAASTIQTGLDVTRVAGHGVHESVLVTDDSLSRVAVPTAEKPELTTSAGDHFNVGLSLGLINGLSGPATVALGNAVASWFVRYGDQPTYDDIRSSLEHYEGVFER